MLQVAFKAFTELKIIYTKPFMCFSVCFFLGLYLSTKYYLNSATAEYVLHALPSIKSCALNNIVIV